MSKKAYRGIRRELIVEIERDNQDGSDSHFEERLGWSKKEGFTLEHCLGMEVKLNPQQAAVEFLRLLACCGGAPISPDRLRTELAKITPAAPKFTPPVPMAGCVPISRNMTFAN